ncbi:MAG: hypothetical protein GTO63_33750 [Anaerolineae bacterium]|nr:hypothetical protein [Anaerolineae bacterium]NIN99602.1 hypothetical protein [Anaerolineae bacterium]NIQ82456.1 hypothetical protein [Anaerolineae bacterium]
MLEWKPKRLLGGGIGIGVMLVIILVDAVLVYALRNAPISVVSFVLGLLLALSVLLLSALAYLLYGLFSLRYLLGRDSLVISWARRQEIIPLAAIQSIAQTARLSHDIKARGPCWPGHCVAWGRDHRGRGVWFYSTGRRPDELLITTAATSYVVSPSSSTGFLSALRARQRLGPARELEQTRIEGGVPGLGIWRDRRALGVAAVGVVANASLFGYLALRYPQLPELVPLLSEAGQVRLIGAKVELFEVPVIGLTVLLANTILGFALHRWERLATYLLSSIALFVQVLCWMAVLSVIR